jgi:branched-chain amino acid transport system substrate-binding protein
MKNRKSYIYALCLFFICLFINSPVFAEETVKIGAVLPMSGPVAYDGQSKNSGALVAIDEINATGGVLGRKIEMVVEDGACNPAQSVAAAEKLITTQKVPVIMGAFCSSSSGAVMEVAKKYKVPHVTGVSTAAHLTERGNQWFFRATDTSKMLGNVFAPAIIKQAPNKKVAFLVVNDDWGRTVSEEYAKSLKELGAEVVATEIFDRADTDLFPYITKIKAKDPDVIVTAANTQLAASVTKQLKQMGVRSKLMGEGAFATETYLNLLGKEMAEGVYGMVEYVPTVDNSINKGFVKRYKELTGELPTKFSAAGYNNVRIIAEAIERAGAAEPAKIRDALEKTNYTGLTGTFRFDDNHQAYSFDVYLAKWENGFPVIIETVKVKKP